MLWAEIGAKRPNYGQNRTIRWHRPCMVGTVIYQADRTSTVLYGANTVRTV